MKIFECKCGSQDIFTETSGNNVGLYCGDCGKWITWLNKDNLRLANRQIESNKEKQEVYNQALDELAEFFHRDYVVDLICRDDCTQAKLIDLVDGFVEQLKK